MAWHRYIFLVTFNNHDTPLEVETVAANDLNAWKTAAALAQVHKAEALAGMGATIHTIERIR